jgi:hypothetical protein
MTTLLEPAWLGKRQACDDLCEGHHDESCTVLAPASISALALVDPQLQLQLGEVAEHRIDLVCVDFPSVQLTTIDRAVLERSIAVLLAPGSLVESLRCALIHRLRQLQKHVIVVAPSGVAPSQILSEGASGVLPSTATPTAVAAALWSSHSQAEMQRRLAVDIRTLENQLTEGRIIGQAKSILAEHLQVPDDAALAHLRAHAQQHNWSTVEFAKTLVFVAELGRAQSPQASKPNRSKVRKRAGVTADAPLMPARQGASWVIMHGVGLPPWYPFW